MPGGYRRAHAWAWQGEVAGTAWWDLHLPFAHKGPILESKLFSGLSGAGKPPPRGSSQSPPWLLLCSGGLGGGGLQSAQFKATETRVFLSVPTGLIRDGTQSPVASLPKRSLSRWQDGAGLVWGQVVTISHSYAFSKKKRSMTTPEAGGLIYLKA